jgi:hypothetical protein
MKKPVIIFLCDSANLSLKSPLIYFKLLDPVRRVQVETNVKPFINFKGTGSRDELFLKTYKKSTVRYIVVPVPSYGTVPTFSNCAYGFTIFTLPC